MCLTAPSAKLRHLLPSIMPTERFCKRQAEIEIKKENARATYPSLWRNVILGWQSAIQDAAWLTYAANYLFYTAGLRWALDPFSLLTRIGGETQPDFASDLKMLDLVVLSHAHNDHLDPNLVKAISTLPITWVIPEFMLAQVNKITQLNPKSIIVPQPGQTLRFANLALTPFEGLHLHTHGGVPEMGYLAEFSGKRWLFPGDTRTFDLSALPNLGKLDGVFAHLWLGKAQACADQPSQLENFCHFFARLGAERIIISHMHEFGRDADDFWDERHYNLAAKCIYKINIKLKVSFTLVGKRLVF